MTKKDLPYRRIKYPNFLHVATLFRIYGTITKAAITGKHEKIREKYKNRVNNRSIIISKEQLKKKDYSWKF